MSADPLPFPPQLVEGLQRIVAAVANDGPDLCRSYKGVTETAAAIKSSMAGYGYALSLGQAEQVYALYSESKWASWITGGCPTVEAAMSMLLEFSNDVLFGENHADI